MSLLLLVGVDTRPLLVLSPTSTLSFKYPKALLFVGDNTNKEQMLQTNTVGVKCW